METIELEINGLPVSVKPGTTILSAAQQVGVKIPKLCFHSDLDAWAACGICVVKVEGSPKMLRACATQAGPGMKITTHDPEIVKVRRTVLELIESDSNKVQLRVWQNGEYIMQYSYVTKYSPSLVIQEKFKY